MPSDRLSARPTVEYLDGADKYQGFDDIFNESERLWFPVVITDDEPAGTYTIRYISDDKTIKGASCEHMRVASPTNIRTGAQIERDPRPSQNTFKLLFDTLPRSQIAKAPPFIRRLSSTCRSLSSRP